MRTLPIGTVIDPLGLEIMGGFAQERDSTEDRFNPFHSKQDGKFTSSSGGFGAFTKSEATVVMAGNYIRARIWSSDQHSIIVTDRDFPDDLVEKVMIPKFNKLQAANPLHPGQTLNVSVETAVFHRGEEVAGLTMVGTGDIKLNGNVLRSGKSYPVSGEYAASAPTVSGLEYVITHEWGHSITDPGDSRVEAAYKDIFSKPSEYAKTDQWEAYAENFAEFNLSGGKPDPVLPSVGRYAKEFGWHK